jgi:predicted MFS family arabinose efflux permease
VALTHSSRDFIAVALLVAPAASTVTRWLGGRYGDRRGGARGLLVTGVALAAAGVFALVLIPNPVAVLIGMAAFGAGFGIAQIASLSLMFAGVPASGYGIVSALWNLAYDAGMGVGAVGFGLLIAPVGYRAGFAVTACLLLAALVLALRGAGPATGECGRDIRDRTAVKQSNV